MSDQPVMSDITSDDKLWALLSWILAPIVPIIVLLMEDKKSRPFIKYNTVLGLAWSVIYIVIGSIIGALTFGIGTCLFLPAWIAAIYWGIKSYQGEKVTVPYLSDFVKKQGWAD
jgi:uncharacterized protein